MSWPWFVRAVAAAYLVASLVWSQPGWLVVCVAVALVAEGVWALVDSRPRTW